MSWHFSRVLEAEYLEACCSDGAQCVPWNLTNSAADDSCSGRMKDICHRSPYGMMSVPLMDGHGQALLTWFLVASRVRTLVFPVKLIAKELMEKEVAYGVSLPESLMKFDQNLHGWKILRSSEDTGLKSYSQILTGFGSMRSGVVFQQASLGLLIKEKESGFWHPTPNTRDYKGSSAAAQTHHHSWSWYLLQEFGHGMRTSYPHPECSEQVMGWPRGWSSPKQLATGRFQQWLQRHGVYSTKG